MNWELAKQPLETHIPDNSSTIVVSSETLGFLENFKFLQFKNMGGSLEGNTVSVIIGFRLTGRSQ